MLSSIKTLHVESFSGILDDRSLNIPYSGSTPSVSWQGTHV